MAAPAAAAELSVCAAAVAPQRRSAAGGRSARVAGSARVASALRKGAKAVHASAEPHGAAAAAGATPAPRRKVACHAVATEGPPAAKGKGGGDGTMTTRDDIRNIAIIAHVDHGKTTLVDALLKQSKVFRENQQVEERIMDSNDLERERGITILAKNTAVRYKGTKINIIDTPGHSDFGGEVERVLNMVDGVLLLVDAVDGPMPQTKFVLKKALELNKKVLVVINKVDRPQARCDWVINNTFDLFLELNANEEQMEFPVVYASGLQGRASLTLDLADDMAPLFDAVIKTIRAPRVDMSAPLQMLITNLDYDEHKGRIAIGRINAGRIAKGDEIAIMTPEDPVRKGKISELFVFDNFAKKPVDSVEAGEICAICGLADVAIGETVADVRNGVPLPKIKVEEPTVRMSFLVNTSPFAGREGKFVTSRNLRDRLFRELERNLAMRVENGETADEFIVCGRGTLHLGILIENMRREGYEFMVGPPKVIVKKNAAGENTEPYEDAVVEVPEEYVGACTVLLGGRNGQMVDMQTNEYSTTIKYRIPTRGLLGVRNAILSATRGTAVLTTVFASYGPYLGDIKLRENGSLVAMEQGPTTSYALMMCQERGALFVRPGHEVYVGMVVGAHQRPGDLELNATRQKKATNIRAASKDSTETLDEPRDMSLDDCIEYIAADELVEVTPVSVRICKNRKMQGRRQQ